MSKKLYSILVMVMLAVLSGVALTACGDDDDDPSEPGQTNMSLIGTKWEGASSDELYTLEFNTNDACRLTHIDDERRKPNDPPHMVTNYYYYTYSVSDEMCEISDSEGNVSLEKCTVIFFKEEDGFICKKAVINNRGTFMDLMYRNYNTQDFDYFTIRLYKVLYE